MKKRQRRRITKKKKKKENSDNLDIKCHAKDRVPSYIKKKEKEMGLSLFCWIQFFSNFQRMRTLLSIMVKHGVSHKQYRKSTYSRRRNKDEKNTDERTKIEKYKRIRDVRDRVSNNEEEKKRK